MPNYNKLILMGHLTRDPELKQSQSGTEFAVGGIAVNNGWGEKKRVCFVDFILFGKSAPIMASNLSKGDPCLLEGELEMDTWETDAGDKRTKHKILASRFTFVGGKGGEKPRQSSEDYDSIPF